jgi:hypothetical protein
MTVEATCRSDCERLAFLGRSVCPV